MLLLVGGSAWRAVSSPMPKADWRAAAEFLDRAYPDAPLIVVPPVEGRNFEAEVARYYLGDRRRILPVPDAKGPPPEIPGDPPRVLVVSFSTKDGISLGHLPEAWRAPGSPGARHRDFPGLRLRFLPLEDPEAWGR